MGGVRGCSQEGQATGVRKTTTKEVVVASTDLPRALARGRDYQRNLQRVDWDAAEGVVDPEEASLLHDRPPHAVALRLWALRRPVFHPRELRAEQILPYPALFRPSTQVNLKDVEVESNSKP